MAGRPKRRAKLEALQAGDEGDGAPVAPPREGGRGPSIRNSPKLGIPPTVPPRRPPEVQAVAVAAPIRVKRNRVKRPAEPKFSLSDVGADQSPGLAVLEAGYRAAFDPAARLPGDSDLLAPAQFEKLLGMSLDFAEYVMNLDLDPDHKHFARVLAIKQSIASSTLTVMARINSSNLRGTPDDGLGDLLERLKSGDLLDDDPYDDDALFEELAPEFTIADVLGEEDFPDPFQ